MFKYNEQYTSKKKDHYYSCKWIESGIVFFQHKMTMCCYCGHSGGGHVMLRNNYDGQELDFDRIFWLKNKFKEFHKKGKINVNCVDCPFLEEKKWDDKVTSINNLYISHWTNCNSKCIYCYSSQNPDKFQDRKTYSILPQIKEMLEKNILKPGGSIHFGGGEPTLLGEFEEIVELLLDYKFYDIRVHTSGIKYSPVLERGIREGRLNVVVSTDAGFSQTYEKIKQVPKFDTVRENIKKYSAAQTLENIDVKAEKLVDGRYMVSSKFIIMPGINDTVEEIEAWLNANKDAGLFTTVIDIEENWYKENKDKIPKHTVKFIRYIRKRSRQLGTNFEMYERVEKINQVTLSDKIFDAAKFVLNELHKIKVKIKIRKWSKALINKITGQDQ